LWDFIDQHRLYHVADYEGDIICVIREGRANAGQVIRIDMSCPPTPEPHRVARSFEQLVIGFGRLREQFLDGCLGPAAIARVLIALQRDFELDEEQMEEWTWFAEVALGEDEPSSDPSPIAPPEPTANHMPIETAQNERGFLGEDVISELRRPIPSGFDTYGSIPSWPSWQLDEWVYGGCLTRSYWTNFEGQAYKLYQRFSSIDPDARQITLQLIPQIELQIVRGRPKPGNPNWNLNELMRYSLQNVEKGVEAAAEIAVFRRRLPELLSNLQASKK
jgi:hypothetical protein